MEFRYWLISGFPRTCGISVGVLACAPARLVVGVQPENASWNWFANARMLRKSCSRKQHNLKSQSAIRTHEHLNTKPQALNVHRPQVGNVLPLLRKCSLPTRRSRSWVCTLCEPLSKLLRGAYIAGYLGDYYKVY